MSKMLSYVDFDQASTSRRSPHKKQGDGLEAPRNSMEFTLEALRDYSEDIPYSCHLRSYRNKPIAVDSHETRTRKLLDLEITNRLSNSKQNAVSRLMGMDQIPMGIQFPGDLQDWRDARAIQRSKEWRKPQGREHPQEEVLQKFKKEFEAWQAAKAWEQSLKFGMDDRVWHQSMQLSPLEHRPRSGARGDEWIGARKGEPELKKSLSFPEKNFSFLNNGDLPAEGIHLPELKRHEEPKTLSPTKIVILKPCPDFVEDIDGSPVCSPELLMKENGNNGSMEAFLEEVKKRLNAELEWRSAEERARWQRIEVAKDVNSCALVRSESTKSDAKKMLMSERLRSILRRETDSTAAPPHRRGRSLSSEEDLRLRTPCIHEEKDKSQLMHRRRNSGDAVTLSPRSLDRSLSAPVSTIGKLLSDEPHLLKGKPVQRKQEASKSGKEASGHRGRFTSFVLRRKLFGKKPPSAEEASRYEFSPAAAYAPAPSVLSNAGVVQENFTEVPPSPASVCSPPDETCRGGYPSPVSPLDARFIEDHSLRKLKEITGVRELNFPDAELTTACQRDSADEITDPVKDYLKRVLVVAGLYSGPRAPDQYYWCPDKTTIPPWVFEKIEDEDAADSNNADRCSSRSHKLLFDLANEVLAAALQMKSVAAATPDFRKWRPGFVRVTLGQRLLNELWRRVQAAMASPACDAEELIARQVTLSSWSRELLTEETEELGREVELDIAEELIDEMVWDVLLNVG